MESLKNIFTVSELRTRIFFTLGLLAVGKYSDVLSISLMAAVFMVWPTGIFGRAEGR